jgi:GT2 family glycosyltransferase
LRLYQPGGRNRALAEKNAVIPDVSVSVVTYENESCVDSLMSDLRAQQDASWEAFVFDNASTDDTVKRLSDASDVHVTASAENVGYSAGHNRNIAASHGRYILLLNADVRFPPDLLARLVRYLDAHPGKALAGPEVLEGTQRQHFPPRHYYPGEGMIELQPELQRSEIAWLNGCCLMARRIVLKELGGFDEDFFLYQAETDLCLRARRAGYSLGWVPEVSVHHLHRQSQRDISEYEYSRRLFEGSSVFWRKHYSAADVARMARFQILMSMSVLPLHKPLSLLGVLPPILSRDRLCARRDVCRRLLSSLSASDAGHSGFGSRIASRQSRLAFEWMRKRRFPIDDY